MSLATEPVTIEIWTDLGCPWCYIGKHRLEHAIVETGADVDLELRSFELNPESPRDLVISIPEFFVRSHGGTLGHARDMEGQLGAIANAEGLPFAIDRPYVNTFDVHRLLQLAKSHGVGNAYFTAAQDAYFAGELDPYDHGALIAIAAAAGVPAADARELLDGDAYADAVVADREHGQALGVTGVPFVVYEGRYATVGAQTVAGYVAALERAVAAEPARAGVGE